MSSNKNKFKQFTRSVIERYSTLTQLNVYQIELTKVESWINNWDKEEHKFIAAMMLDKLVYRSSKMAKSSFNDFFTSTLRDYYSVCLGKEKIQIHLWLQELQRVKSDHTANLIIAPVRLYTDSGSSGDVICRMCNVSSSLTKHLTPTGFENKSGSSTKMPTGKVILLVDDILGNGEQIQTYSKEKHLENWSKDNHIIYAPLIALKKGLTEARDKLPFIRISPIETLDDDQCFFSFKEGASFLSHYDIKESEAITWYKEMLSIHDFNLNKSIFGRNNEALTLAFEWGCPNHSLGALWWASPTESKEWTRLFKKRD